MEESVKLFDINALFPWYQIWSKGYKRLVKLFPG